MAFLFGIAALAVAIIPTGTWIVASRAIVPGLSPLPKTVWLLNHLRIGMPLLGAALVTWVIVPSSWRSRVTGSIPWGSVLTSSWAPPVLVLAATALAIAWIVLVPTQPYADSQWYYEKAIDLSQGRGYVMDLESRKPTAAWPVGYPAFLALLFHILSPSVMGAKLVNVALLALTTYFNLLDWPAAVQ